MGQGKISDTLISRPMSGVPSLEVNINTRQKTRSFPLTRSVTNIGRDLSNEIVIKEPAVSDFHLQIVRQGNQLFIIHPHPARQRSSSGLLYRGRKIHGDEQYRQPMISGDIYRIVDENGTLITLTFGYSTSIQEEILPPVHPIKLDMPELTIGRRPENMVVLNHPQVSGHHAKLIREGGTYRIIDLNSTNHVYVNSERIGDHVHHVLRMGDEIRIGPYKLIYKGTQLTQYDESDFIRVDALHLLNDISFSIPACKFVAIMGASGVGKSTLMDALNGSRPTDRGKVLYNGQDYYKNWAAFSTQLGYVPQDDIIHFDLTVERVLYYAAKLRLPSDFTEEQIEQRIREVLDEVELTPRRKLLVKKLSIVERKRASIALELLTNPSIFFLNLANSRLDPGLDRKIMFLLRSLADRGHTVVLVTHATNNIMAVDYVCFLAQGGRVAYYGPPEQAKVYFGKTDFAEMYSSLEPTEDNPNIPAEAEARFHTSPEYQEYVVGPMREGQAVASSSDPQRAVPEKVKRNKRANPFKQFLLLFQRNTELLVNDRANLVILLLQAPLIALLLMLLIRFEFGVGIFDANNVVQCLPRITTSLVQTPGGLVGLNTTSNTSVDCNQIKTYLTNDPTGKQFVKAKTEGNTTNDVNTSLQDFITEGNSVNVQHGLFIIVFVTIVFSCINGLREFIKEDSIYRRERMLNLGIAPYIFSKIAVLGILCLLQCCVLVVLVNLVEPFQQGIFLPPLLEVYVTLFLTSLTALTMGLAISAIAPSNESAISLTSFILVVQMIFAGSLFPLQGISIQLISLLFPMRWAMAALGSSIGLNSSVLGGDKLIGGDDIYHGTLLSIYNQTDAIRYLLLTWLGLLCLLTLLCCLIAIFLKRKDHRL